MAENLIDPKKIFSYGAFKLGNAIVWDQILYNTSLYGISDSKLIDNLWKFQNAGFLSVVLDNSESKYAIRQFSASSTNLKRYTINRNLSAIDYLLSAIMRSTVTNSEIFSTMHTNRRIFKRLMLLCELNGGIYKEFQQVLKTLSQQSKSLSQVTSSPPFTKHTFPFKLESDFLGNALQWFENQKDKDDIKTEMETSFIKLFEKEFKTSTAEVFDTINFLPVNANNGCISFNATLKGSGLPVTVSCIFPETNRMKFFDSIPFYIRSFTYRMLPFLSSFAGLENAFLKRSYFTIKDEIKTRQILLQKLGFTDVTNKEKTNEDIAESAQNILFPIAIPAPLPKLCSKNIMVTPRIEIGKVQKMSTEWTEKLIDASSQALFEHQVLLPNVAPSNVIVGDNNISLDHFSGCPQVSLKESIGFAAVLANCANNDEKLVKIASQNLSIRKKNIRKLCEMDTISSFLPLFKYHGPQSLGFLELSCGLISNARNSGATADIFKPLASRVSQKVGMDVDSNIISFFDNQMEVQCE